MYKLKRSIHNLAYQIRHTHKQKTIVMMLLLSILGRACLPHASAYSISKFGVEAFSDALRRELSMSGVQVSVIEPGFFKTNITNKENLRGLWKDLWAKLDPSLMEEYGYDFYQTSKTLKKKYYPCVLPCAGSFMAFFAAKKAGGRAGWYSIVSHRSRPLTTLPSVFHSGTCQKLVGGVGRAKKTIDTKSGRVTRN